MAHVETDFVAPARHNPHLHRIVIDALRTLGPGHVLDLPAGPGYLIRDLMELGFTGVAADIDESLHCLPELTYAAVDMTQPFPFGEQTFDYVVSIEGIEHVVDPFAFLAEVRRVLKPNGRLILTTPNVGCLESRWHFLWSGFHSMEDGPIALDTSNIFFEHINPMTLSQLWFACERQGLRIERLLTSRHRKGARVLYWLGYPLWRWAARRACLRGADTPRRRDDFLRLYRLLSSRENLVGGHTIIVAAPREAEV
jgi:SAM-dependent methyltransferase